MIPSLGEALVLAAQQRVKPETFFKFRFRSHGRLAFPNLWLAPARYPGKAQIRVLSGLPVIRPEP